MKTHSLFRSTSLLLILMAIQVSCAQQSQGNSVDIIMTIDYGLWENGNSDWYNAISFTDNTEDSQKLDRPKKGRKFKTKVKKNQKLKWMSSWATGTDIKEPPNGTKIILINVARNPGNGGDFLLDEFWYDSEDNGVSVNGRTRKKGFPVEGEERYIISFAVVHPEGKFDIYTVDPIIRGNE